MKLEPCGMGVIKRKFRRQAQYFGKNNYLFVEIKGANLQDNQGMLIWTSKGSDQGCQDQ